MTPRHRPDYPTTAATSSGVAARTTKEHFMAPQDSYYEQVVAEAARKTAEPDAEPDAAQVVADAIGPARGIKRRTGSNADVIEERK